MSGSSLLLFFVIDALVSAVAALLIVRLLPREQRGRPALLLCFALGFFVPLAGLAGMLAVALAARRAARQPRQPFALHATPVYDPLRGDAAGPRSKGGVRVQLADASVSIDQRLRAAWISALIAFSRASRMP